MTLRIRWPSSLALRGTLRRASPSSRKPRSLSPGSSSSRASLVLTQFRGQMPPRRSRVVSFPVSSASGMFFLGVPGVEDMKSHPPGSVPVAVPVLGGPKPVPQDLPAEPVQAQAVNGYPEPFPPFGILIVPCGTLFYELESLLIADEVGYPVGPAGEAAVLAPHIDGVASPPGHEGVHRAAEDALPAVGAALLNP